MEVGDLVEPKRNNDGYIGIVIEKGIYTGNKDTKVLWECGRVLTYKSEFMKVVNKGQPRCF